MFRIGDRDARELLFLPALGDIEFLGGIEVLANGPLFLAVDDADRVPAFGADDVIRLEKLSEDYREHLAALDVLAVEGVGHLVEVADEHGASPPSPEGP